MERFKTLEYHNIQNKEQLYPHVPTLIACITSAFGHEMPAEEVEGALTGEYFALSILTETDAAAGYIKLRTLRSEEFDEFGYSQDSIGYSLGAITVMKPFQGQGISKHLNQIAASYVIDEKSQLYVTRTQNPRVEKGIVSALNMNIETGRISGYKLDRICMPNFYGRRLTQAPLQTDNTPFSELNVDKGDCFRLIFHLQY